MLSCSTSTSEARQSRVYDRKDPRGATCEMFEGTDNFRPSISDRDEMRMKNNCWARRAARGKDRHIVWSSSHDVDPQTGRIMDPDPLGKDDY